MTRRFITQDETEFKLGFSEIRSPKGPRFLYLRLVSQDGNNRATQKLWDCSRYFPVSLNDRKAMRKELADRAGIVEAAEEFNDEA